jgi:N-acetylmuramoyl-L-alanine amidase
LSLNIQQRPLSYINRLENRRIDSIDLVVIHCTELPDLAMARVWGEKVVHTDSQTGNSGHFYIDRDGSMEEWVPVEYIAHHVRGLNSRSIGIELVNTGRYPHWFRSSNQQMNEPYPDAQIGALVKLLNHLAGQMPGIGKIAGHADLDYDMQPSEDQPDTRIRRKLDPGPLFPWAAIMHNVLLNRTTSREL